MLDEASGLGPRIGPQKKLTPTFLANVFSYKNSEKKTLGKDIIQQIFIKHR